MNISWSSAAVNGISIGLAVLFLHMLDRGWFRIDTLQAKIWALYYAGLALWLLSTGFYNVLRNENVTQGVVNLILSVLDGVIAWELWKRGRPPRHKRRRVRNAVRWFMHAPVAKQLRPDFMGVGQACPRKPSNRAIAAMTK